MPNSSNRSNLLDHSFVLGFHSVVSATPAHPGPLDVSVRSLQEFSRGKPGKFNKAVFTFDDAYADFYELAWPIIREAKNRTVVFVPTAYVGVESTFDHDFVRPLMTWGQISELSQEGVLFGSHGVTHRPLADLPTEEMCREVRESKATLENRLGCAVTWLAYPNGSYDDRVLTEVEEAGYEAAFTVSVNSGQRATRFSLPRILVTARDTPLRFWLRTREPFLSWWRWKNRTPQDMLAETGACLRR